MWNWFKRIKEANEEYALDNSTTTTTTEPAVPFATEAKRMSNDNLDKRIKRAEKAIFDKACRAINEQIKRGYLYTYFDAFDPVYHIDEKLDKNSIIVAINDCIHHLATFGYTAQRVGERQLSINWQYPKEITLNDIEWSI